MKDTTTDATPPAGWARRDSIFAACLFAGMAVLILAAWAF